MLLEVVTNHNYSYEIYFIYNDIKTNQEDSKSAWVEKGGV